MPEVVEADNLEEVRGSPLSPPAFLGTGLVCMPSLHPPRYRYLIIVAKVVKAVLLLVYWFYMLLSIPTPDFILMQVLYPTRTEL